MGGTILRLVEKGWKVGILDLTSGEPTPRGSVPVRLAETAAANSELGRPWRENLGLPNRNLEPTLDHRRALASVFRRVKPRLLFAPFWEDAHPDHTAATKLIEDARFWSKLSKSDIPGESFHPSRIFYYFNIHLRIVERPSFVLDISEQAEAKRSAMRCYQTQLSDAVVESVMDRNRFWGNSIGVRYAEPFASREPIGLSSLEQIVL
jgi:bacillithiol biosynthesis deacetylase BshB1